MQFKKIETRGHDFYGLKIFRINGKEYAAGTPEQADLAAQKMATDDCIDLAGVELLLKHSGLPSKAKRLFDYLDGGCDPERQQVLASLIDDLDALAKEAIALHGRAHYLGLFDNGIELSLNQFPTWCAEFILSDLGLEEAERVCLYNLMG